MKSYRQFFNYRDNNLVRSMDSSPEQKSRSNVPSRQYSRKTSQTPQDLGGEPLVASSHNNYFIQQYKQSSEKIRSQSHQSHQNHNALGGGGEEPPRPLSVQKKGQTIDVVSMSSQQQDEEKKRIFQSYNGKIFNNFLNHTINVDFDVRQNGQKKYSLNQSFNQKYEKLKNLYMRQGAKSSQGNLDSAKGRDSSNGANAHNNSLQIGNSRAANYTPKENFYSKTKIYGQGINQKPYKRNISSQAKKNQEYNIYTYQQNQQQLIINSQQHPPQQAQHKEQEHEHNPMNNLDRLLETISTKDTNKEGPSRKQSLKKHQLAILQPKRSLDQGKPKQPSGNRPITCTGRSSPPPLPAKMPPALP